MITTPAHALQFGALDLLGRDHSAGWWIEAAAEGADFGAPEPIVRAVASFLMDGDLETTDRYGNREMTFRLAVYGTNSTHLGEAEAALKAEVGKRNQLYWTPPDNSGSFAGSMSTFRVVNSAIRWQFDDLNELNLCRIYTLTIKALPFAYGGGTTSGGFTGPTSPPTTGTPVNTLVDSCSSLTGWAVTNEASGFGSASLTTSAGIITASQGFPHGTGTKWIQLARTGLSVSMTSTPNVRIKFNTTANAVSAQVLATEVRLNGTLVSPSARNGDYAWYPFAGSTLTSVTIKSQAKFPDVNGTLFLKVDEIYRTDSTTLSTQVGQRQIYQAFDIVGSARTPGTLYITTAGATALGSVLAFTIGGDMTFQPNLRAWLAAGPTETTDTSLVSGKSSPLSTVHYFNLPEIQSSGYLLMARVKHASAGTYTLNWASDMVPTTTPTTPVTSVIGQSGSQSVTLAAGVWTMVPVAKMVLPVARSGVEIQARVSLSGPSGVLIDDGWLFDVDNGRLTQVECGTGTPTAAGPFNRLDLLSADIVNPLPAVLAYGTSSDDVGVGIGGGMGAFMPPEYTPPGINVFVVTTGSVQTVLQIEYVPSWDTHVAVP